MRSPWKRTLAVAALLAAVAGLAGARRHRRLSAVDPELRHPRLYIPMSLRNDTSLRVARTMLARAPVGPVAAGVDLRTAHVPASSERPDVRVIIYESTGRARPSGALLWIHGGGLVMGTPEMGHELCSRFAAELGIVVVSVDYRLAPEHPFPAGLDDCYAVLEWIHRQAEVLGVDTTRVVVGGDSAGGGLAACLAQRAHDAGGPAISFQLLQYPMLDDRSALRDADDALVWTKTSNRYGWQAYLGHPLTDDEARPYAVAARRTDLTGLPPTWIGIGSIDLFHDECIDYADRLRAAGVACERHEVPGMYHGAEHFVPSAPSMRDFIDRMVVALGSATSSTAERPPTT